MYYPILKQLQEFNIRKDLNDFHMQLNLQIINWAYKSSTELTNHAIDRKGSVPTVLVIATS